MLFSRSLLLMLTSILVFLSPAISGASSQYHGNLRFNPLVGLIGLFDLDADFPLNDYFTFGPKFSIGTVKTSSSSSSGTTQATDWFGMGARANVYFNGAYQSSYFLSVYGQQLNLKTRMTSNSVNSNDTYKGEMTAVVMAVFFGYHRFWSSKSVNMSFGLGAVSYPTARVTVTSESTGKSMSLNATPSTGLRPAAEVLLGWAF